MEMPVTAVDIGLPREIARDITEMVSSMEPNAIFALLSGVVSEAESRDFLGTITSYAGYFETFDDDPESLIACGAFTHGMLAGFYVASRWLESNVWHHMGSAVHRIDEEFPIAGESVAIVEDVAEYDEDGKFDIDMTDIDWARVLLDFGNSGLDFSPTYGSLIDGMAIKLYMNDSDAADNFTAGAGLMFRMAARAMRIHAESEVDQLEGLYSGSSDVSKKTGRKRVGLLGWLIGS